MSFVVMVNLEINQQLVSQIGYGAADDGDGKESGSTPCGKETDRQGYDSGNWRQRGFDDCRKGHHCQGDIRHIIQEASHEHILYASLDESHRQDAYNVGGDNRQHDADDYLTLPHGQYLLRV